MRQLLPPSIDEAAHSGRMDEDVLKEGNGVETSQWKILKGLLKER